MASPVEQRGDLIELGVGRHERASVFAVVIDNLAAKDRDQPGAEGGATVEIAASFEGGEERFLNEVFGRLAVADAGDGVLQQRIAVAIDPLSGVAKIGVGGGWFEHKEADGWKTCCRLA